ncbi:hypothetical protein ABZ398_13640, partial [Streptomyces sp. NPDC005890]
RTRDLPEVFDELLAKNSALTPDERARLEGRPRAPGAPLAGAFCFAGFLRQVPSPRNMTLLRGSGLLEARAAPEPPDTEKAPRHQEEKAMTHTNENLGERRSKRGTRLAACLVSAGAVAAGVMLPAVTASAAPMPRTPTVAQAPAHHDHGHGHHYDYYYSYYC